MSTELHVVLYTVTAVVMFTLFLFILWVDSPRRRRNKIYLFGSSGIAESGELLKEVVVEKSCAHMVIGGTKLGNGDEGLVCYSANLIIYVDHKGVKHTLQVEDGTRVHISRSRKGILVRQESL